MLIQDILAYVNLPANGKSQKGASLVEYGLLVALIAVACILALTNLGQTVLNKFTAITNALLGI